VRDLPIPKKEQYPVPPGQNEFVPMPPEEAIMYRDKGKAFSIEREEKEI
jgi:hypothetical protein